MLQPKNDRSRSSHTERMRIRSHGRMLDRMGSTSVRINTATHQELKRLASELGSSVGDTVALAVRRLRQEQIGVQLSAELTDDETDWLDADLG